MASAWHRSRVGGAAALAGLALWAAAFPAAAEPPMVFADRPTLRLVYETTPNPPRHLGDGTAIDWRRPGVTLELLKRVGAWLRINVEFKRVPWKRGLLLLETGEADGIFHASYVPDREAIGAYPKTADGRPDESRALFFQSYALFVTAGSPVTWDGTGLGGLEGRPVGATAGYAVIGELERRGVAVEPGRYPSLNLAKLVEGRIAAYAELETMAEALIRRDPERFGSVVKRGPPLLARAYYLMLSHPFVERHPALAEAVWSMIAEIRDAAEFRALEAGYADGS